MNTTNPFQVPSCLQRACIQQRRQNRLKQIVIGSIAALAILLIFLLVAGCMSDRAKSASLANKIVAVATPALLVTATPAIAPEPDVTEQPKPVAPSVPVALSPLRDAKSRVLSGQGKFYVVKSGDTLARIAKEYHVPVKTLMVFNNLNDDRLVVGTKLVLPTA